MASVCQQSDDFLGFLKFTGHSPALPQHEWPANRPKMWIISVRDCPALPSYPVSGAVEEYPADQVVMEQEAGLS